ncbi:MAG: permease, partial [Planctomycetota bacterium]
TTFLFAGPAINVGAIFLTGTVLGWEMSFVRLGATIASAVLVGLIMAVVFETPEEEQAAMAKGVEEAEYGNFPVLLFMGSLLAILVILNLKREIPAAVRYPVSGVLLIPVLLVLVRVFRREDRRMWIEETWDLTKKILPYLLVGVIAAGLIRVFIPDGFVQATLGANRLLSCVVASVFGAVMYFATLTEVPVIQVLMTGGMGKGPSLTLFMAGYTLSLPNMIVLVNLMGWKKAMVYIALIMGFSTLAGIIYGNFF